MSHLNDTIARTVYSYGSPCTGQYGHCVLRDSGVIYGYYHENESSWSLVGEELLFHRSDGEISSRFVYCEKSGAWSGHWEGRKWPLYLVPVISLNGGSTTGPSFFINSIPKAGTYFASAALDELGNKSAGIHLMHRDVVVDFRGQSNAEMHVAILKDELTCSVDLVAATVRGGHLVGHIEFQDLIDRMRALDICVLSVVRDLRDVLVSMFRFKLERVAPICELDCYWRELDEESRFIGFLLYSHDRDFNQIRNVARTITADPESLVLRYEHMLHGVVAPNVVRRLESYAPGMSDCLAWAFRNTKEKATSTFSGRISRWREYWTDEVERYFNTSGMAELNKALGYDETF